MSRARHAFVVLVLGAVTFLTWLMVPAGGDCAWGFSRASEGTATATCDPTLRYQAFRVLLVVFLVDLVALVVQLVHHRVRAGAPTDRPGHHPADQTGAAADRAGGHDRLAQDREQIALLRKAAETGSDAQLAAIARQCGIAPPAELGPVRWALTLPETWIEPAVAEDGHRRLGIIAGRHYRAVVRHDGGVEPYAVGTVPSYRRHASWHPDPYGYADQRWWDGDRWTDDVRQAEPAAPATPSA